MKFLFSHLPVVKFKAHFHVRCVNNHNSKTLTNNKRYFVVKVGFNGYYKIKGDTNRYVWHKPNRFKKIKERI